MAHHQGMTIVALANVLEDGRRCAGDSTRSPPCRRRSCCSRSAPRRRSRWRARGPTRSRRTCTSGTTCRPVLRRFRSPHDPTPRVAPPVQRPLLGHGDGGRLRVLSRWQGRDVTRWREDVTRDRWGTYIFLRDVGAGRIWSAGYQPAGAEPDFYEAVSPRTASRSSAATGRSRRSCTWSSRRRTTPRSGRSRSRTSGTRPREIEVTSYAELVARAGRRRRAPTPPSRISSSRRSSRPDSRRSSPRGGRASPARTPIWAAHVATVEGETVGAVQYETDRARFLGRGRGIRNAVLDRGRPPALEHRRAPSSIRSSACGGACGCPPARPRASTSRRSPRETRERGARAGRQVPRPGGLRARARRSRGRRRRCSCATSASRPDEAHLFQRVANRILYSDPTLRAPRTSSCATARARPVSGPTASRATCRSCSCASIRSRRPGHRPPAPARPRVLADEGARGGPRRRQRAGDVVRFWTCGRRSRRSCGRGRRPQPAPAASERRGAIFVLRRDLLSAEDHDLLRTAARGRPALAARHARRAGRPPAAAGTVAPALAARRPPVSPPPTSRRRTSTSEFFNGLGGFAEDGREYVTILGERQWTPAPWINVIANPSFGFLVSESGSATTWAINSQQNQLTPWSNDPVTDPPARRSYVRDEETGRSGARRRCPIARRVALRRPARRRATAASSTEPRHRARADAVRAARRTRSRSRC